jgi:asparagine synthase (glutamine-hydrolysing)
MCGICGEIRTDGGTPDLAAMARMVAALVRRGPDAGGVLAQGATALGHRRLKIIDTSEMSSQPMVDPELGLAIVFNGAIYNYRELRVELEGKGYRFFSSGDTEVLIKAYHAWGTRFVERLNGMFAFAIRERDSGRIVLARDRLGIKPLYLARAPNRLRFASTLPALLAAGEVDTSINPRALNFYMTFHAVVPAPDTILTGVEKLPPATVMTIEADGATRQEKFWSLTFGPHQEERDYDADDWEAAVLDGLRRAVKRRLVADVPVGALLSGGLDSSLIVALLAEAGAHLRTFSSGFDSVDAERGDEFQYSDIVVQRFATDHTRMKVDTARVLPALDGCIEAMSEPMMSHDAVAFYLLSEEVSRHVKVVQSGQGADEVFAGYHWYPPLAHSNDPAADYARVFFDRDHAGYRDAVTPAYRDGDAAGAFVARHFDTPGADDPVDKALRLDATVMLVDDPVKRVDNMTMAFGLEARVPFLDHELVELAARIPAELKIADGGKGILKRGARKILPNEVIDRPKGYFPVPALKYLRGPYFEMVRDLLSPEAVRRRGLFAADYVGRALDAPDDHISPLNGSHLWQMAVLEKWLQEHGLS